MKPGTPLSVKGPEPQDRAAAILAPRPVDLTLGEWLQSTVVDQSESAVTPQVGTAVLQDRFPTSVPRLRQRARAESPPVRTTMTPELRPDSALTLQLIERKLADLAVLAVRVEENESKTVDALGTVNSRLSLLSQQIMGLTRPLANDRPPDTPAYRPHERAVRNSVERVEVNEKPAHEPLKSIKEKPSGVADRGRSASLGEDMHRAAPLLAGVDRRLTDMLKRIEHVESLLAEQIKTLRVAAQQMANQAQSAAVNAARGELRELEGRLLATSFFAIQKLTSPQQAADQTGHLPGASATLASLAGSRWSDASAQPPRASRSGPPVATSDFDLAKAVPEARALLARLGLSVAGTGDCMDGRLANAIRLFELRSGLKVTGDLTPDLLVKLRQQIA